MRDRLNDWFTPPRTGRPADTLRWVRRVHFLIVPSGLLVAALLLATGSPVWWIALASTAMSVLGAATMGPVLRRAEQQPPLDPATAPERRRRAMRVTAMMYGVMTIAAGVVIYFVDSLGAAIVVAALMAGGAALGLWLLRHWMPPS